MKDNYNFVIRQIGSNVCTARKQNTNQLKQRCYAERKQVVYILKKGELNILLEKTFLFRYFLSEFLFSINIEKLDGNINIFNGKPVAINWKYLFLVSDTYEL